MLAIKHYELIFYRACANIQSKIAKLPNNNKGQIALQKIKKAAKLPFKLFLLVLVAVDLIKP
jgi:hypothetical protein